MEARRILTRIESQIADLGQYKNNGYAEHELQSTYFSIVAGLRSVGHVLYKTDCAEEPLKRELASRWKVESKKPIFTDFIEKSRNSLVKDGDEGLDLRASDASFMISADPKYAGAAFKTVHVGPENLTDTEGRLVMPLLHEAVAFWNRLLGELEALSPR